MQCTAIDLGPIDSIVRRWELSIRFFDFLEGTRPAKYALIDVVVFERQSASGKGISMSSVPASNTAPNVRYHGLDALRAWAMSLGIVLHAAWIMIPGDAGAPATDASANSFFEWLCLAIHTFRMQLFFFLAGFFACLLLRKRGISRFSKNRLSRIVVPLAVSWLVLCPVMMWQYNAAGLQSGAIQSNSTAWELTRVYFANITADSTMLLHLWFLYYLSWTYVIFVAIRSLVALLDWKGTLRQGFSDLFAAVMLRPWSVLVLAALTAPMIWVMKGCWGIEVGLGTLYLKWPGVFSYLLFFVAGWLVFRNVDKLDAMLRGWRWQLALGLLITVPYFYYAKSAVQHGYSTWDYPKLMVEHIRYDHENDRFDYPLLRSRLIQAETDSVAHAVWTSLPEPNRQFVIDHEQATDNQLAGLLSAINTSVLGSTDFTDRVDLTSAHLSETGKAALSIPSDERSSAQIKHLNREILEAGFAGLILTEDVHRPHYYSIRAAYSYVYSLTTWLLILGCLGLFHAYCNAESRFWRYFSDSSYWMYLAHLPIQFQILLWIGDKPWSGGMKFLVYVFGTMAILVPSYHFLVRPTWIGWLLNGKMIPIRKQREPTPLRDLPHPAMPKEQPVMATTIS